MAIRKKGFFYTLAAIALSVIILFSFKVYTETGSFDKMSSIETRIITMNNFIKDIEDDIENAIFIAGFRSILSLEDYMMEWDKFFNDVDTPSLNDAFSDVFLNGTIVDPNGFTEKMGLMEGNNFLNWTQRIELQADKNDIKLGFTVNSVTITQTEPWMVDVSVNLDISVQDKKNTATWSIDNKVYTKKLNITTDPAASESNRKFVDPLYIVFTDGKANNTIRQTTVPDFSTIGNLQTHVDDNYYIANTDAPSYLNRFESDKKFTASANGIESLADVETISGLGLGLPITKTAVDHLYFDTGSSQSECNVDGIGMSYDWFYLDFSPDPPNHLAFYGASCAP